MASVATPPVTDTQGMNYLVSLPRRIVTTWVPLTVFLIVLLFPFYWMVITSLKPDDELLSREGNPFWVHHPTFAHIHKLLFETSYPEWLWNTMLVSVISIGYLLGPVYVLIAIPIASIAATLVDVVLHGRDPAEEEAPAVLFPGTGEAKG